MSSSAVTVLLVGKRGAGKTVLCKNLLGREIGKDTSKIEKMTIEKEGTIIHVIDTPGSEEYFKKSAKETKLEFDLLILCIPVSQTSKFHEGNPETMQWLQNYYGKDIWRRCILVFTFSNMAWDYMHSLHQEPQRAYTDYIRKCLQSFQAELRKKTDVQAVLAWDDGGEDYSRILAIPAGIQSQDPVLANSRSQEKTWVDEVHQEIRNKCRNNTMKPIKIHQSGKTIELLAQVAIGAGVGMCVLGPIGAIGGAGGVVLANH